jgi:DNA repair ATPase RecN
MFEKQKYSRENYEDAEKAVDIYDVTYREAGTPIASRGYSPDYEGMVANIQEAEKRLAGLKTQGHKEARDLNERYDKLKKQASDAAHALFDFEREQLGMHERNN